MARCGCNNAMGTTCEAIMSCIVANLGRGLDYNETTREIDLRISTDAGNAAIFGSDDGFYAPTGGIGPGPMVWPQTVATLPADAMSAASGSNLVGPATAPELIEYSIGNGIDIYSVPAYGLADGTIIEQLGEPTTSVTAYTDNPGSIDNQYLSSLTLQQLQYDAGTRASPTSRNSDAPAALLTPDGGWGGFFAPVFKPRTIDEMLRQVRGRMVVELLIQRGDRTTAQIERDITNTVAAVVAAGAQEWVIIQVPALLANNARAPIATWVPIVTAAGIAAGVNAMSENQMASPFTPAEIVASGADWVMLVSPGRDDGATDARISSMVAAGLEVVVATDGRQFWTTHAFGLGARVVRSSDAVYSRGVRGVAGDLNYRQNLIPGLETKTAATGALTPVTDQSTAMWNAGFARTDLPGRWFPSRYGADGATPLVRVHQLLGTICPIPNATDYRITLRVRRDTSAPLSSSQTAAIFFASADDRDFSHLSGSAVKAYMNGYQAVLRSQPASGSFSSIQLYRVTAGMLTSLGTVTDGASLRVGEWTTMVIEVNPTNVLFSATDSVTTSTINVADTTYRGAYAAHAWNDEAGGFVHGYDNPGSLVMYEPTP